MVRRLPADFYLGVHNVTFLERTDVPLFISRRRLAQRKRMPQPIGPWALDSGGFTELHTRGGWVTSANQYLAFVAHVLDTMRAPEWVAPQDWMCEPFMLRGRSVREHQARTVDNFATLRAKLGPLVVPVLQGFTLRDYERCIALYYSAGVNLLAERIVGLGSVCRRSGTIEASRMVRALVQDHGLRLHGFGIKGTTFASCYDVLTSADSMAWSYAARRNGRDGNALSEALTWRERLLWTAAHSKVKELTSVA